MIQRTPSHRNTTPNSAHTQQHTCLPCTNARAHKLMQAQHTPQPNVAMSAPWVLGGLGVCIRRWCTEVMSWGWSLARPQHCTSNPNNAIVSSTMQCLRCGGITTAKEHVQTSRSYCSDCRPHVHMPSICFTMRPKEKYADHKYINFSCAQSHILPKEQRPNS